MNSGRFQVYLSGPIRDLAHDDAISWRGIARRFLEFYNIGILDPMDGKLSTNQDLTPNEIVLRDIQDVKDADVILCNYSPTPGVTSWGTPAETALATYLGKPVVFVLPIDSPLRSHPWVRFQAARIFTDVSLACDYIRDFWSLRK